MKTKQLILLVASSLMLAACGGSKQDYGAWPTEDLEAFFEDLGFDDANIPAIKLDICTYGAETDEDGDYFYISSPDEGTIGVDSYEDQYVEACEKANWTVDDSAYEVYGYYAFNEEQSIILQWYTYNGTFDFYAWADITPGPTPTEGWPEDALAEFFEDYYYITDIEVPSIELDICSYQVLEDDYGASFYISTDDFGEVGEDSYEDAYYEACIDAGWSINSDLYESYGYLAYDPTETITVQWFTYDGEFVFYAWAGEEVPEEGGEEFPTALMSEFFSEFGITNVDFTNIEIEGDNFSYMTDGGEFIVYCHDSGIVGDDSYEDLMLAKMTASNWLVSDENYDSVGYEFQGPTDTVEGWFYTYDGDFSFVIFPKPGSISIWPGDEIADFFASIDASSVSFPELTGGIFTAEELFGTLVIEGSDYGTIGVDSYEDILVELLDQAGWDIDDTYYDSYGYVCTDPSETVQCSFYTYYGIFELMIYHY